MPAPPKTQIVATALDSNSVRVTIPAWGMSLALHIVLLTTIGLVTAREVISQGPREVDRPAAIVLVQPTSASETEYWSDADAPETQSLSTTQPTATSAAPGGGGDSSASESAELNALLPTPRAAAGDTAAESALAASGVRGSGTKIATDGRAEAELIAREQKLYQPKTYSGPPTKVSLFGSPAAEGRSFVFVLDRSASTGGQGLGILDAAQQQLVKVVAELGPTHRFQIIAYNQKPHYLGPQQMTLATDENKPLVAKFFQTVGAYGSTDHEMALRMALKPAPDVIFLMTDGSDPFLTPYEIKRIVEIAGGKTAIHAIQFGRGEAIPEGAAFMQRLANETGGSYTFVDVNRH